MLRSIALSILGVVLLLYGLAGLAVAWYSYSTTQQVLGQVRSTAEGLKGSRGQASSTAGPSLTNGSPTAAREGVLSGGLGSSLRSLLGGQTAATGTGNRGDQQGPALLRLFDQQVSGLIDQALALVDQVATTIMMLVAWQTVHAVVSLLMGGVVLSRAGRSAPSSPTLAQAAPGGYFIPGQVGR